ncbi:MAG: PAS domain S-box protein [Planctomycetaceae bacterium]|nr:PAS domain S-box protein [Planctomycetaceae bacterium]
MTRLALFNSMPAAWNNLVGRGALSHRSQSRRTSTWMAFLFSIGVFAVDCAMPSNGALVMLYVLPISIALGSRRQESLISMGGLCVLLTIAGYFIGETSVRPTEELIERGTALIAMGLMAWVGWQLVESVATAQQLRIDSCLRQVAEDAATFFRSMVDHVPIGISRTDLGGHFVYVNEEFCQMFGTSADDLLGKPEREVLPQFAIDKGDSINRRIVDLGQPEERIEKLMIGEHELYMKVIRTPVKDAQGHVVGIQALLLDVTELKRAQHGLERHAQNLERSNLDLQQFAYVASHDLQEPLRAVSSYCQLIEKNYSGQLDERAIRWLQFVVNGAQRMQSLVRDLLTYARIDNKAESWITVDSNATCRQAIENLSQLIAESGAQITVAKLPIVWADGSQLEALFQNLIGNAVKFRSERPSRVSVTAKQVESNWLFAVRDNGIGIKPEFQERVFEIFKRLQSQDQYPGTGIGLAICKRIVERYGGRIWVESQFGQGSTFYFTLPSPHASPEPEHASP